MGGAVADWKSQRLRGRVQVADSQGTPEFRDSHLRTCETNFAHAHLQDYRIAGDLEGEEETFQPTVLTTI